MLGALVAAPTLAAASPSPAVSVAEEEPPYAIETFEYPNAAKILAEKKIKLFKGDGHILLAECSNSPEQIKLWVRGGDVCFQANAKKGYLALEVPNVWGLETASHPISADLVAEGKTETVSVSKTGPQNGYQSVGEGTVGGAPTVLVQLRVTG
ncbi:hypothetical protein [Streptomyces sp. NPDC002537]